jgi:hypothetical protein
LYSEHFCTMPVSTSSRKDFFPRKFNLHTNLAIHQN